jgi:hypothetical protein
MLARRLLATALALGAASATPAIPADPAQQTQFLRWFVAPDGNDEWDGLEPQRTSTSGPFRTPARALEALKASSPSRDSNNNGRAPFLAAMVELLPGTYFLDEPLRITPEHCRHGRTHLFPAAQPGDARGAPIVLSGGRLITGWRRETLDGRELFVADVPAAKDGGWRFHELWIDGRRRPRARQPDHGYLAVAALDEADAGKPWNEGVASFRFDPKDSDAWRGAAGAEVTVMSRWVDSHVRVATIDVARHRVALREPTVFKLDPGDPYFLDGARAFLDAPGEWWLDEVEGRLYVVPDVGEDLARCEVVAPRLDHVLDVDGHLAQQLSGLTLEGLTFSHCEWWFPPAGAGPEGDAQPRQSGFPQAAVGVPAAVRVARAKDVRFDRCAVEHVGGYGLQIGPGCEEVACVDGRFADLGAGGVKIGEMGIAAPSEPRTTRNTISGCTIRDGGRLFQSAVGVWIGQSPGNRVLRNEIGDLYYTGISIGWTWGYGPADAGGQHVSENEIHHVGKKSDGDGPILSDMGGIYTLGAQDHTTLLRNWIHDVAALRYGGWGIYLDEGTTHLTASDNLVVRTTHGGFHQHYGKENLVERNVFAFGRDAQLQRSRAEPHLSFTFRRNVVLFGSGDVLAGDFSDGHFLFEENLYWREDGREPLFGARSFEEWQARGFDHGSRIEDPRFTAPRDEDWSIPSDSPARTLLSADAFGAPAMPLAPTIPWALAVGRPRNR